MSQPKKKTSRSRRDLRRYSAQNSLTAPSWVESPIDGMLTRPHRITRELIASGRYLEATAKGHRKAKAPAATPSANK